MITGNRNILKCVFCGAEIITGADSRRCYKCDSRMEFIGKEVRV